MIVFEKKQNTYQKRFAKSKGCTAPTVRGSFNKSLDHAVTTALLPHERLRCVPPTDPALGPNGITTAEQTILNADLLDRHSRQEYAATVVHNTIVANITVHGYIIIITAPPPPPVSVECPVPADEHGGRDQRNPDPRVRSQAWQRQQHRGVSKRARG